MRYTCNAKPVGTRKACCRFVVRKGERCKYHGGSPAKAK